MTKTGKIYIFSLVMSLFAAVLTTSCKSEFEKIRVSGDVPMILKKADDYYEKEKWQQAQTLYELVTPALKGSEKAERVFYRYAWTQYKLNKFILANYYFENFANTFTTSPLREECAFMAAYSHYELSPTYRLEQSYTEKAVDGFQSFVNLFPTSKKVEECNKLIDELRRKLEEKAFAEGQLYYDLKQYQSAMLSFDNLLKDFPESPEAEQTRLLVVKSAYELAENSVVDKRVERYATAIEKADQFLARHPKSKFAKEARAIRSQAESQSKIFAKK